jgi:hypothetical protein
LKNQLDYGRQNVLSLHAGLCPGRFLSQKCAGAAMAIRLGQLRLHRSVFGGRCRPRFGYLVFGQHNGHATLIH